MLRYFYRRPFVYFYLLVAYSSVAVSYGRLNYTPKGIGVLQRGINVLP
jgi:hypothetical protein